jgi:tetratricopeptide (TPR) repeat protein
MMISTFRRVVSLLFIALLPLVALAQEQPATKTRTEDPAVTAKYAEERRLQQQGKFDAALASLRALETQTPQPAGLAHEFGVLYYKQSDFENATKYLEQALKEDLGDNEATQLLGISDYLLGRPQQAIPLLEKVQTWFPQANVDGSYILGICYIQTKQYDSARAAFGKMFNVPKDSAAAYLFTARMLLRQEYDPVAEEYATKAVTLDARLPLAHFLLGELHLYKSRVPEAVADFEQELKLNPGYAPAYYKLADAYSRLQKFDDAERLLQRSIWLDATSTGPYILMGKVLQKKGEPLLAVRSLQRAATMDPNNPITHHLLGQAFRDLGQSEDADRELKLAEQLNAAQSAKR